MFWHNLLLNMVYYVSRPGPACLLVPNTGVMLNGYGTIICVLCICFSCHWQCAWISHLPVGFIDDVSP